MMRRFVLDITRHASLAPINALSVGCTRAETLYSLIILLPPEAIVAVFASREYRRKGEEGTRPA